MVNDKFKQMMCNQVKSTINQWEQKNTIVEKELYTFLHNLKGTAGSIGMPDLSNAASSKLEQLDEKSVTVWERKKWKNFISQIEDIVNFFHIDEQYPIDEVEQEVLTFNHEQNFILVIDDDMVFVSFIKEILEKKGFIVIVAHNGKRGLNLIYELNPALVFIDINLPDQDGFSMLESINKIKKNHMFVAIISVDGSKENRKKAYDLGAFDFIKKPLDRDVISSYVKNRLTYKHNLELSIVTDELTQVYNRKFLNTQLEHLIQNYINNGEIFSIAILDIDFFKKVNDTYGHIIGDDVLKGLASLIMAEKRMEDILCRYGGEEFVLVMPNTSKKAAYTIVERLRKIIAKQPFYAPDTTFHVTFSAGITEINELHTHQKVLMEQADQSLYKAKESGRNQTIIYAHELQNYSDKKFKLIIIDDVSIIRKIVVDHFEKIDAIGEYLFEVESYEDGVSFLNADWYEENTKYIILLDGIMPKLDGLDVLKAIREKYSSNEVIVSMLTSLNDEEYILEAFTSGADDFIVKPFNISDVSNRLLKLVNLSFLKV